MVSGALTSGRPEPNQIMLEISEDQNLEHNSGARQHLLALEQLGFTLAMGSPWPWMMTASATPVCSGTTPPLNWGAASARGFSFRNRSKPSSSIISLKAAGSIRSRPPEGSAQGRGNPGRQNRRIGSRSRCGIMPPRRAIAADRGNPYRLWPGLASTDTSTLFTMLYSGFKFRNQRTPMADSTTPRFGFVAFAETWNGRLAMLGFVIGLATELLTGQGILGQIGLG